MAIALLLHGAPLLAPHAGAQSGRVRGLVLDQVVPVSGAAVTLRLEGEEIHAVSDSTGRFTLFDISSGRWEVAVRRLGYAPYTDTIDVTNAQANVLVQLRRSALALGAVRIAERGPGDAGRLSDFYDRQRRARSFGGRVYDRNALATSDAGRLTDFLAGVPGVTVTNTTSFDRSVMMRRCRGLSAGASPSGSDTVRVFLDGVRVRSDPMDVLSGIGVNEIEALEVYQGVSQLPAEVTDGCAAIFIWRRVGSAPTEDRP